MRLTAAVAITTLGQTFVALLKWAASGARRFGNCIKLNEAACRPRNKNPADAGQLPRGNAAADARQPAFAAERIKIIAHTQAAWRRGRPLAEWPKLFSGD
jgi:hypothetical protein